MGLLMISYSEDNAGLAELADAPDVTARNLFPLIVRLTLG